MAHLMHDLASWFKLDEIDIDNWMFKAGEIFCQILFYLDPQTYVV